MTRTCAPGYRPGMDETPLPQPPPDEPQAAEAAAGPAPPEDDIDPRPRYEAPVSGLYLPGGASNLYRDWRRRP